MHKEKSKKEKQGGEEKVQHAKKSSEIKETLENTKRELEDARKLAEEYSNQLKYLQADFDNYRKWVERQREEQAKSANRELMIDLLPVLDDIEAGLRGLPEGKEKDGLTRIHDKILGALRRHGLEKIEAVGKKFDSHYHEAIATEKSDKEDGTIIEEVQKGYMLRSRVLRHSKVRVCKNNC